MMALDYFTISRKNRVLRGLWKVIWTLLFRPSPSFCHFWRCFLLRLFGAKLGHGVHVYPSVKIWAPWNLKMANGSCLGHEVICYNVAIVSVGRNATVSQYSHLCTATHDYTKADLPLMVASIIIGDHAWVTADVFVGPGVKIGTGSVINSRSSVFTDIPAWVVARGNPALSYKVRKIE